MKSPRTRAEEVARRIRTYGDTKRGPHELRYMVNDAGCLRIEARAPGFQTETELAASELAGTDGIAKACDAIERVLQRLRDILAKATIDA